MATHSCILAWRIPWTEEPGRLQSMGLQRVRHDWVTNTHTHTHTLPLSGKWVKSYQPNSEIRSVIKACGSHLFFHYLEKAHLNLLSGDTDWEKEHIFSHVRKPGVIEHPHLEKGEIKKITVKYRLFTSCFWNAGFVRKNQRQQRAQSITTCSWCGCAGRNVHVVGSQKWSTGKKVALFLKGRQGRKATFVELPLALKVLTNSKVSIWT